MHLADDLFLIAHDDAGRPRTSSRAVEVALAAALLAELVLLGRITVHRGQLAVIDREPPPDALTGEVLDQILAQPQYRLAPIWLAVLAGQAIDAVGQRLERAGIVEATKRAWRRPIRYRPVDPATAAQPRHRLALRLNRGEAINGADGALAGLVHGANLSTVVLDHAPPSSHQHIAEITATLHRPLRDLIAHLAAAISRVSPRSARRRDRLAYSRAIHPPCRRHPGVASRPAARTRAPPG